MFRGSGWPGCPRSGIALAKVPVWGAVTCGQVSCKGNPDSDAPWRPAVRAGACRCWPYGDAWIARRRVAGPGAPDVARGPDAELGPGPIAPGEQVAELEWRELIRVATRATCPSSGGLSCVREAVKPIDLDSRCLHRTDRSVVRKCVRACHSVFFGENEYKCVPQSMRNEGSCQAGERFCKA